MLRCGRGWVVVLASLSWACDGADETGGMGAPGAGGFGGGGMLAGSGAATATGGTTASGGVPGTGGATGTGGMTTGGCTPDASAYAASVQPLLQTYCGDCHQSPPQGGAPFDLLSYDATLAAVPGGRPVDRMVAALGDGRMPPAGYPRPTPAEFDTLTGWASCGTAMPPYPEGLRASREVFVAPAEPPAGSQRVELLAGEFPVPQNATDLYESFYFDSVVDEEMFVRRIDAQIDATRVVHHITLHYANADNDNYLYTWAPGTGAVEFPDGGLRVRPGDRFRVEIHYNNAQALTGIRDSSGILFYTVPVAGTEYAMLDPATFSIVVPAGSTGRATVTCTAENDFHILAGMPHMHEIGDSFSHELIRTDGSREMIIELSSWSFELQYFYDLGVDVKAGDQLVLTCDYINQGDTLVTGGQKTSDEMCYDFIYVTPAAGSLDCGNQFGSAP